MESKKMIKANSKVIDFLKRKQLKAEENVCRIFLVAQHCHGAQFAYRFEAAKENDKMIEYDQFQFFIPTELLDLYEGFQLELQSSFLWDRLLINPLKQVHKCSCAK
jgi:Fe-S cluster assembly iron-binding protein IscA